MRSRSRADAPPLYTPPTSLTVGGDGIDVGPELVDEEGGG